MKQVLMRVVLAMTCVAFVALASCAPPSSGQRTISITGIGWVLENIDTGYWTNGFNAATCFGWFSIGYSGDISVADIDYAQFHKVGDSWYWSFPIDSASVDTINRHIHSYLNYTTTIASNGSVFPIGQLEFEVGLKNGSSANYLFVVPAPGQLTSPGKDFVYTEDYAGTQYSNYAAMLRRPNYISQTKSGTISLSFSCNDSMLFSGYVDFYDSLNNVVGWSPYFRAYGTGVTALFVNGGSGIYNNGTVNNAVLQPSDISFLSGRGYSDITKYSIRLSDGAQYLGTNHTFDCLSIGPTIAF